jgi:hypothetical protein
MCDEPYLAPPWRAGRERVLVRGFHQVGVEEGRVTGGLGTLTPAAASFYTGGTGHGQHISFGGPQGW